MRALNPSNESLESTGEPLPGRLLILSGPSGVGKDTVIDAWSQVNPRVHRVVACTTRAARIGEIDGVDYQFFAEDEFLKIAEQGAFLEYKNVHGNWYATPVADVERMLLEGKIAILKIDVQGAAEIMKIRPDALSVFLLPPNSEELERRIRGRGTENDDQIAKRLQNARDEIAQSSTYQFQIINDGIEQVVKELERIVR